MVKEHPILFSGPMVQAILEGDKNQTRRVMKLEIPSMHYADQKITKTGIFEGKYFVTFDDIALFKCLYGQVGDHLWVRETWAPNEAPQGGFEYKADRNCSAFTTYENRIKTHEVNRWRPSIHMPRIASRIQLEITGIRAERLNSISHSDACFEGIENNRGGELACIRRFQELWDSINADRGFGWEVNPWVWVIEFKRLSNDL